MDIFQAVWFCIYKKYASFKGRASRGEFLAYFIFYTIFCLLWVSMVIGSMEHFGDINLLDFILMYVPFFLLPPLISVTARRFHDCSKSGWLIVLLLIPMINLFGFYLLCRHGSHGPNRYGPIPLHVTL